VLYDPSQVSYAQLVDYFWRHIDPTVKDQQFCDVGSHYRSGIYWQNEAERATAEASRDALISSGRFSTIHTELAPSSAFYLAEDYHQDYYKKNEMRYSYYRLSCGRDARVKKLWG
jgi:peptide-methionine (S)-S-oxide reductase